jgi:hypothetical protein
VSSTRPLKHRAFAPLDVSTARNGKLARAIAAKQYEWATLILLVGLAEAARDGTIDDVLAVLSNEESRDGG